MGARTSQRLEEVPMASMGQNAESQNGWWANQWGNYSGHSETFLHDGDPHLREAHPLELLVHTQQFRFGSHLLVHVRS